MFTHPQWKVGDVLYGPAIVRGKYEDSVLIHPRHLQGVIDGSHTRICSKIIYLYIIVMEHGQSCNSYEIKETVTRDFCGCFLPTFLGMDIKLSSCHF